MFFFHPSDALWPHGLHFILFFKKTYLLGFAFYSPITNRRIFIVFLLFFVESLTDPLWPSDMFNVIGTGGRGSPAGTGGASKTAAGIAHFSIM